MQPHTNTETHAEQLKRIERYGWKLMDQPGVMMEIGKDRLVVDETYQRDGEAPKSILKIKMMVRDWSWIAFGVIIVALRQNVFYVVDGQHRVIAARRRADVGDLPCIVFETTSVEAEAKGFLQANTQRKPITGADRFRALVVTNDPAALLVKRLCDQVGREVKVTPAYNAVRCVSTMLRHASNDPTTLERLWPLLHNLVEGQPINERLVDALVYIEKRMPKGESLLDRKWRERLMRVGATAMVQGAVKAAAFYAKGGSRVWALGVVQALNYNHRNHLKLEGETEEQ